MSSDPIQTLRDTVDELAAMCGEGDADIAESRDALARLEQLRDTAAAYAKEVCDEWTREADPSDPDEIPPPWQETGAYGDFIRAALAGCATTQENT